jgi:OOP family OmpA-OmpF porin
MKKILAIALLSTCIATPTLAADNSGKLYIGGDLGSASYSNVGTYPSPGMVRFVGGYHFNPLLALEVGFTIFGESKITAGSYWATLNANSFQVSAVGTYPVSSEVDLIGKLGIAANHGKSESSVGSSVSASKSSVLFGVGAQYHLSSQLALRAQYEDYGSFEDVSSPMKATTFSLGMTYDF